MTFPLIRNPAPVPSHGTTSGTPPTPSAPPEYSSVLTEFDPPPTYPGYEDAPPTYFSVFPEVTRFNVYDVLVADTSLSNGNITVGADQRLHQTQLQDNNNNNNDGDTEAQIIRNRPERPWAPIIIGWFDIFLNCPILLLFFVDVLERKMNSLGTLWIININFLWIRSAIHLLKSTNQKRSPEKRRKFARSWEKFNIALIWVMGIFLTLLVSFVLTVTSANSRSAFSPVILILILTGIPVLIRIGFSYAIHHYIRGIPL